MIFGVVYIIGTYGSSRSYFQIGSWIVYGIIFFSNINLIFSVNYQADDFFLMFVPSTD